MNMPCDQAAAFHVAKRLGQHFLRDSRQASMQHAGPRNAAQTRMQNMQDHARPFRGKQIKHAARRAILAPVIAGKVLPHSGYPTVPMTPKGAV